MNKVITYAIIGALVFILGWVIGFHKQPKQQMPEPIHHWHTDIVYDTITDVQCQSKYITRHDTAYLQCIDTMYKTDTVMVEIPIYQYKFDTAGVKASVSGYNVTLDSLEVERKIITDSVIVPFEQRKWHLGFGFALGFGYVY